VTVYDYLQFHSDAVENNFSINFTIRDVARQKRDLHPRVS